jgi:Fe2+ transport system protein B
VNNWRLEYIVVMICGACLLGVVFALIFSRSFRQDLTAQPGKLSIFGISIEGVVIVLLVGLMIGAMLYSINKYSGTPSIPLADLPISVTDANDALQKINQLANAAKEREALDIIKLVRNLKYEQPESAEIRSFPQELIGPWSVGDKAEELL